MSEFFSEYGAMMADGTVDTLYMVLLSSLFGYLIGMPLGIILTITSKGGIAEHPAVYRVLDIIVNILRSIPFLILLILIMPLTKAIVGRSYGTAATVVPLTVSAAPFIAREVESSLKEVDKGVIEMAQSMGASNWQIIWKVLVPEARTSLIVNAAIVVGTILGYSAMAGTVGGGGLGDIAIQYGYYRYETGVMIVTVVILVVLVQILQGVGMGLAGKLDHRK